jgi:endonuclease/exonuclease/phosphatase family metal-dependent hydrolase
MHVRVATANLHGLRAGIGGLAGVFGAEDIDVAMVQESGPRGSFRKLAERLGMERVADPPALLRRRVQDGLLVRRPWRVAQVEHHRFSGSARFYPRGAVIASLVGGGGRLWVVSTHLGLAGAERVRHARDLRKVIGERRPFILGGDLNAEEDSPVVRVFNEIAVDAGRTAGPTFPASAPTARIDYLFVSSEIEIGHVGVTGTADASDHLVVVADLRVPTG